MLIPQREFDIPAWLSSSSAAVATAAVQLGMSPSTVGNHVRSIQARLGARTRIELGLLVERLASWGVE
jgi:DNA-binding CsgD family transcriptional regulator